MNYHNIILVGPPDSGKTMLAKRIPGILPPFTLQEALETTKIRSISGNMDKETSLMTQRSFRAPTTQFLTLLWLAEVITRNQDRFP